MLSKLSPSTITSRITLSISVLFSLLLVSSSLLLFITHHSVDACGHGHHHHHTPEEEAACPLHSKNNENNNEQPQVTSELVRRFHSKNKNNNKKSSKKQNNVGDDDEESYEIVNLVSVRFSHNNLDQDPQTTDATWTCNPEIVAVDATKARKSPHGYYVVPVEEEEQQQNEKIISSKKGKGKKNKINANSKTLLSQESPDDLIEQGLATDAMSTSQHSDIPVHALAFDHPDFPSSSIVHLFRDPRFERLHAGHYPTKEEDEHTVFTKKTSDRVHDRGLSSDLPKNHPAHECTKKGECHIDRVHMRHTAVELFWIPQSVKEVVFSCSFPNSELHHVYKNININNNNQQQDSTNEEGNEVPSKLRPHFYSSIRLEVDPQVARREAETLGSAGPPEVIRLREVGPPSTTYSIVFVSGGFRLADRQMFIDNVTHIADMLMDPSMDLSLTQDTVTSITNMHRTVPFNRYFGFWNAYAVYQPSNDDGASRPLVGLVVDNNLGCYHPAEIERAVSCDRNIASALVKITPAPFASDPERVVIICVVNTAIYGGSAIYIPGKMHFANFFNGFDLNTEGDRERMLSLVDHEVGHALGNLMDEYSVGVAEPSGRYIKNCQVGNGGSPPSPVQWSAWLQLRASAGSQSAFQATYASNLVDSPPWDLQATPVSVCGFTNYFKPNENCMMQRLNDFFMCPVCREQATMQVFQNKFVYDFPRLPYRDQILLVSQDTNVVPQSEASLNTSSTVVVHLNRLVSLANGFTIQAWDSDGSLLTVVQTSSCPACIQLGPTNFAKYPVDTEVRILVNITDTTKSFMLQATQLLYQSQIVQQTYFRIVVSSVHPSNISGATLLNYSTKAAFTADLGAVGFNESDLTPRYVYCLSNSVTWQTRATETGLQRNNSFCSSNLSRSAPAYQEPAALAAVAANLDTWVPIALGAMAIVFILLWLWASQKYTDMSNGRVRPIFKTELSTLLSIVRGIMTASAVVFLIASIVAIGGAAYVYYNTSLLGKIFVIFGIILAVILYLMAFVGFWAVSSRSKRMLMINGVVLLIPLGIGIWLLITLNSFGTELNGAPIWNPSLNATGSSGVTAEQQIGEWMKKLELLWIWLVSQQPDWACAFEGVLECSGFYTACAGTMGSTATCPSTCPDTNERFTSPCQKHLQEYIVNNYSYAVTAVALGTALLGAGFLLNTLNFVLLWQEKSKIQNRNQAVVKREAQRIGNPALADKQHDMYSMMLLKSLDKRDRTALVAEFKRIDRDGNGELTRGELAYFINGALKHKPSKAEIDKIFSVADLDNSGTISLREFLMIFGWESGEIDDRANQPRMRTGPLQKMASFARRTGKEVPPGYQPSSPYAAPPPPGPGSHLSARRPSRMNEMTPEQAAAARYQMRQRAKDVYGSNFVEASPQGGEMAPMNRSAPPPPPPPQSNQYQQQHQQQAGSVSQQPISNGYQGRPPIHDDHFEL